MDKGYILFVVINSTRRFKKVKRKLTEMGYSRFTIIPTYGITAVLEAEEVGVKKPKKKRKKEEKGNQTLCLVVQTETEVKTIMDALEFVQNINPLKPGKGIMFTVPLYASYGVRFEH